MKVFEHYLEQIENLRQRKKIEEIFDWITNEYPQLESKIAWNQPMFTDHGTFIIGFSVSKNHLAITTEKAGISHFTKEIEEAGYEQSMMIFKIKWDEKMSYDLLKMMIDFNLKDKANCLTFWRK